MNKRMAMILFAFASFALTTAVVASPAQYRDSQGDWQQRSSLQVLANDDANRLLLERRVREERGVQRLKQHKWQTGYVMPLHYRGDGYKVEYREYNLPKPARNQQWYRINNDFILLDAQNNSIVQILRD